MFCTFLANELSRLVLAKNAWIPASAPFIALWIGDPGPNLLGGAEVSSAPETGYVRKQTLAGQWDSIGGYSSNNVEFAFPIATAYWGTVTHVVLLDSTPLPLFYGPLTAPKEVDEGSIARFKIGALEITLT